MQAAGTRTWMSTVRVAQANQGSRCTSNGEPERSLSDKSNAIKPIFRVDGRVEKGL